MDIIEQVEEIAKGHLIDPSAIIPDYMLDECFQCGATARKWVVCNAENTLIPVVIYPTCFLHESDAYIHYNSVYKA